MIADAMNRARIENELHIIIENELHIIDDMPHAFIADDRALLAAARDWD